METRSDEELVNAVLGNQQAFDQLVERYYNMVFAIAYARLQQREVAEEATQETFLRAYVHLRSLKQPQRLGPWLGSIARNISENWREQNQLRSRIASMVPIDPVLVSEIADRGTGPREHASLKQESRLVKDAIGRLPVEQREVVLLHYIDGLSKSDIARRIGVVPSSVSRQLDRAIARLREHLGALLDPAQVRAAAGPSLEAKRRATAALAALVLMPAASRAIVTAAASAASGTAGTTIPGGLLFKISEATYYGGKAMLGIKLAAAAAVVTGLAGGVYYEVRESAPARTTVESAQQAASGTDPFVAVPGSRTVAQAVQPALPAAPKATVPAASSGPVGDPFNAPRIKTEPTAAATTATDATQSGTSLTTPSATSALKVTAATPDYLAEGMKVKFDKVRNDMRTYATAIEAYWVDHNKFPESSPDDSMRKAAGGEAGIPSFRSSSLTTPVAYLTKIYDDHFAKGSGQPYGYYSINLVEKGKPQGWILFSAGPDGKFDLDWKVYDPAAKKQPQDEIAKDSYDPTNGAVSAGDIYRIKQ